MSDSRQSPIGQHAYITLAVADAPHRLILAENGKATGTLTVAWNTSPMHGPDPAALLAT